MVHEPRRGMGQFQKVSQFYGTTREQHLKDRGYWKDSFRRSVVTHFTGCEPSRGEYNPKYNWEAIWTGMQKALTFADNQVLSRFGFVHPDLLNPSVVSPLPFDFLAWVIAPLLCNLNFSPISRQVESHLCLFIKFSYFFLLSLWWRLSFPQVLALCSIRIRQYHSSFATHPHNTTSILVFPDSCMCTVL